MTEQGETDDGQRPTVLIVEDERGLAELYRIWLSDYYHVIVAYNGEEALEKFDESIDIILLDRRMPGMSGDIVLEKIRETDFDGQIAMVSGVEPDEEIADMPIDEYLTKPVAKERFETAVDELLLRTKEDAAKQELLALLSRKATLEERMRADELAESEEYRRLVEKIEWVNETGEFSTQRISSKYRPDACPACDLRWDVTVDGAVGFRDLGSNVWKCARCGEVVFYSDPSHRSVTRR